MAPGENPHAMRPAASPPLMRTGGLPFSYMKSFPGSSLQGKKKGEGKAPSITSQHQSPLH